MKTCYNRKAMTQAEVTSVDLAKRLKALGVKQDSEWYWYYLEAECPYQGKVVHSTPKLVDRTYRDEAVQGDYEWDYAFLSAFTREELTVLLPPGYGFRREEQSAYQTVVDEV